jgi:glycosyltransferase involved in cell wall biosynthesis
VKILWGPDQQEGLDLQLRRTLDTKIEHQSFNYDDSAVQVSSTLPFLPDLLTLMPDVDCVFLLEPLKRLPPRQIFQSRVPIIAFSDLPIGLSQACLQQVLGCYDGLVALSPEAHQAFQALGLPVFDTIWLGLEPHLHAPLAIPDLLYDLIYIASNPYSPALADYEPLPAPWKCHYFIATTPAFMPFYFQRSRYVLCDDPGLSLRQLEALACGAVLLCPESLPQKLLTPGLHYLSFAPGQLAQTLNELEANHLVRETLQAAAQEYIQRYYCTALWERLEQEFDLLALQQRRDQRLLQQSQAPESRLLSEALTLGQSQHHLSYKLLPEVLKDPRFPHNAVYFSLLAAMYTEIALHPLSLSDPQPLLQQAHRYIAEIEPPLLLSLQAMIWAWKQAQWGLALHHLKLIESSLDSVLTASFPPLLVCKEILFQVLSVWYEPSLALRLFCKLIELECLSGLRRWQELLESASEAVQQAILPAFFQFQITALNQLHKTTLLLETYAAAQSACPLELPFRAQAIALLGEKQPEPALKQAKASSDLAARYIPAMENVEIFLALERLILQKHPPQSGEAPRSHYLLWEGAIQAHHSLARINRRLLAQLEQDPDLYLTVLPFHPPEFSETKPPGDFRNHQQMPNLLISHRWPPRMYPPQQGKWVNILPWEHGVLPSEWVQKMNAALDQVWVPSQFVARSFVHSGLLPERVRVIPNGVDTDLYCPDGPVWPLPTQKKYIFLFVGGLIRRKGVDILLQAYAQAFRKSDDVALVIKGFGEQGVYSNASLAESLRYFREDPNAPELHLITRSDLSEAELASLYRAADVYVHPYRGEGFGLPILEAMACGLPVVVPDAGPALEFSSLDSAWYVPTWVHFELGKNIGTQGLTSFYPYYHEVDITALADCLKKLLQHPAQIQAKGLAARAEALNFSWQTMYQHTREAIAELSQATPAVREAQALALEQWQNILDQPDLWPQIQGLPDSSSEPCLPWLQRFLQHCLATGQKGQFNAYLRQALLQGLSLEQWRRLQLSAPDSASLALRIHWPEPEVFLIPNPFSQAHLIFQPSAQQTQFQVQTQPPWQGKTAIVWLDTPSQIIPLPEQARAVLYCHPDQAQRLLDLGWSESDLLYLPPAVDFSRFDPRVSPLILEESQDRFCFFACPRFSQPASWQILLNAYFSTFKEPERVNLVLKPVDLPFEEALEEVMQWLESQAIDPELIPSLTFVQEDLAWHNLPGLLTGSQVFIELATGTGFLALAAQAAGCKVIATGQYPFLERPFAEACVANDPHQLGWLMRKAFQEPMTDLRHSGQAVREYLQVEYTLEFWQARVQTFFGRLSLFEAIR